MYTKQLVHEELLLCQILIPGVQRQVWRKEKITQADTKTQLNVKTCEIYTKNSRYHKVMYKGRITGGDQVEKANMRQIINSFTEVCQSWDTCLVYTFLWGCPLAKSVHKFVFIYG